MKIYYKIITILLIFTTLFIFRNEVFLIINNVYSYFNQDHKNIKIKTIKEIEVLNKVDMPGALRVVTDMFESNQRIILSKDKIIELTNKYRLENGGLKALRENKKLNLSAERKMQDMFSKQYFEHISPDNIGVATLSEQAGYSYILIGENLAMGDFKNDESLIEAWIKSEGHRENIVNKNYQEIGVAVGRGDFNGQQIWIAVQHFGLSQDVCPSVDKILFTMIDLNQNKLKKMETDLSLRREMMIRRATYEGNTYQEQVQIYNSLVDPYNNLINETKQKIINYNKQVELYNGCLSIYQ